jgi:hypothetical protein
MNGQEMAAEERVSRGEVQAHRAPRTRLPHPRGGDRRLLFEELRCVAVHEATAEVLERRAATSTSPVLAGLLRERAARHRGAADRLRRARR